MAAGKPLKVPPGSLHFLTHRSNFVSSILHAGPAVFLKFDSWIFEPFRGSRLVLAPTILYSGVSAWPSSLISFPTALRLLQIPRWAPRSLVDPSALTCVLLCLGQCFSKCGPWTVPTCKLPLACNEVSRTKLREGVWNFYNYLTVILCLLKLIKIGAFILPFLKFHFSSNLLLLCLIKVLVLNGLTNEKTLVVYGHR